MLEEKIKTRYTSIEEGNNENSLRPPSPPTRHEKLKGACLKPSRTWTSEESQRTTERIVRNMFSVLF